MIDSSALQKALASGNNFQESTLESVFTVSSLEETLIRSLAYETAGLSEVLGKNS